MSYWKCVNCQTVNKGVFWTKKCKVCSAERDAPPMPPQQTSTLEQSLNQAFQITWENQKVLMLKLEELEVEVSKLRDDLAPTEEDEIVEEKKVKKK